MRGSADHISAIDDASCPENAIFLLWQITQTMQQSALGWAEQFTVHPHPARGMAEPLPHMTHVEVHPASKLRPWWTPGLTTTNGLRVSLAIGGNVEVVGFAAPDFVNLATPLIWARVPGYEAAWGPDADWLDSGLNFLNLTASVAGAHSHPHAIAAGRPSHGRSAASGNDFGGRAWDERHGGADRNRP